MPSAVASASSSAIETRSAGPLLERMSSAASFEQCARNPRPAARAASIIANSSSEACSMSSSVLEPGAPEAGGQQHRNHRRSDPEPDRGPEIVDPLVADDAHTALDQDPRHLFLRRGA